MPVVYSPGLKNKRVDAENVTPLEMKRRRIRAADDALISAWLLAA